jgi:hypothetical protein
MAVDTTGQNSELGYISFTRTKFQVIVVTQSTIYEEICYWYGIKAVYFRSQRALNYR